MRYYLSSYKIGDHAARLLSGDAPSDRVAIIQNASDGNPDEHGKRAALDREMNVLAALGLCPTALDLRNYFGLYNELRNDMASYGYVWVMGGNTFVLKRAFIQSGLDRLLTTDALNPRLTYGGYSAGACILCPTLNGIHLADQPDLLPHNYPDAPIDSDGLGLLDFCIAPHYRSNHPESALIERCVQYFLDNRQPFVALRDGDVLIGNDERPSNKAIQWTVLRTATDL